MTLPTLKKTLCISLAGTVYLLSSFFFDNTADRTASVETTLPSKRMFGTPSIGRTHLNVVFSKKGQCPSVLSHMTQGRWKTRPLSKKENDDMIAFLTSAQSRFRFPSNYQRSDGLCGNVTHTGSRTAEWFRALCDPKGATPCCYQNKCAKKSLLECVCEDCYDMRQVKHAEYSTWTPSHPSCPYTEYNPQEACDILRGMKVVFVGDSLVRHVYTAMLLIVSGNMKNGAMRYSVQKEDKVRSPCEGMYMFTEKKCRKLVNANYRACNGTVDLSLLYYFFAGYGPRLKDKILSMDEKSLVFTGIGIHSRYDEKVVQKYFLSPALNAMKNENRTWPRFVWAASHAPGVLKSPVVLSQTYDSVKKFNARMEPVLKKWNIPVFDTFNLTEGVMSFDGEHYGMGMNIVKANLLLSYIKELREGESW